MIIDDLYVFSTSIRPPKTNPPLLVDTNTVLARSFAFQGLEGISRRYSQIIESRGDFELPQLSPCDRSDIYEPLDANACR